MHMRYTNKSETHLFSNIILKSTKPSSCTKHDPGTRGAIVSKSQKHEQDTDVFISLPICGTFKHSEYNILSICFCVLQISFMLRRVYGFCVGLRDV